MASSETARFDTILAGIVWMGFATLLMACVTGIVRYIGSDIPASQSAFLRYVFGLLFLMPWIRHLLLHWPKPRELKLHGVRGLMHGVAVTLWFYAMARIPIAEVTALGFATPIFVTIGAIVFLGERLHRRRVAAVLIGFAGTAIILRPGFQEISTGQVAQLLSAPCFAVSYLIAKRLTAGGHPITIVMLLSLFTTVVLLPGAVISWVEPTTSDVLWLALTAAIATGAHYAMTRAMHLAPLSVTQPVAFLQLVWATILGVAAFGEPVDPFVILGGGLVVGAITFISHREAISARRHITPPPAATKY